MHFYAIAGMLYMLAHACVLFSCVGVHVCDREGAGEGWGRERDRQTDRWMDGQRQRQRQTLKNRKYSKT